jgi:uncharacterized protein YprB with RNaseH-like and TPR domain
MLENTFCHVPGIGYKREWSLWQSGILTWEDALRARTVPLSAGRMDALHECIRTSISHLSQEDARHFAQSLSSREHWRLFPQFRHSVAYLDIETTGLGRPSDYVTTIAIYDGHTVHTYVQGQNIHQFAKDIVQYELLITYNGKSFDLPFIRNDLSVDLDQAHIDLRYVLASLGYKGGLKRCERRLGIDRGELVDVDGYFAVLLWQDYKQGGNPKALNTLLAYNVLDVVNLERLMILAYNEKLHGTPFEQSHTIAKPSLVNNPFRADLETIYRLKQYHPNRFW